ncbi:MAG: MFS transporter [Candidatus Methanomethylicaceae archaeon]
MSCERGNRGATMISYTWRLNIATMLFFTLIQVVVPLVPRYALVIGAQPFMIGLAVSSISITAIVFRPIGGVLSDMWSRRNLMLIGLLLGSCAYAILFLSKDIITIMMARLLEGIAIASFVPSSIASAIDYAPEGRIGEALGWRSLMIGIGFSVGPALGGLLSELFGYVTTFGITAVLILSLIPLVLPTVGEKHHPVTGYSFAGLRDGRFLLALVSLVIYAVAWMGLLTFLSAYLKLLGYGDIDIGLFASIQAVASLTIRVSAGRASDRNPRLMTAIGLFLISLSFFVVYLLKVPPNLYVASLIFGIGVGFFVPASQTLALAKTRPNSRGFLSSIYTMGMDVGNLGGPIIFGAVIQTCGSYESAFAIAPVLPLLSALLVLFAPIREGGRPSTD